MFAITDCYRIRIACRCWWWVCTTDWCYVFNRLNRNRESCGRCYCWKPKITQLTRLWRILITVCLGYVERTQSFQLVHLVGCGSKSLQRIITWRVTVPSVFSVFISLWHVFVSHERIFILIQARAVVGVKDSKWVPLQSIARQTCKKFVKSLQS